MVQYVPNTVPEKAHELPMSKIKHMNSVRTCLDLVVRTPFFHKGVHHANITLSLTFNFKQLELHTTRTKLKSDVLI